MGIKRGSRGLIAAVAIAIGLAAAAGCDDDGGPQPLAYAIALQKWESSGTSDYSFDVMLKCFCALITGPMRVEVRGNTVASARLTYKDEELSEEQLARVPTIDDLFAWIAEAIQADAAVVDASYDDELGYPVNVFIDRDERAIDDELEISVSSFQLVAP